ncbi:hypothetical protein DB35_09355 [Streptomyces abyssalis]|uniref:DUF3159 domain-containing protein n=1 Tax=Streptomyces abyssalis TaxID=933944 RepID=A0A1E7JRW0_9ACTN|nr:DUF3159 domain-containing protein [Streptomyces abyssalis]OEU91611.1 hypothetical protein AN215_03460 [Streptomyces abyssalis]OEU94253.1 hypothetical protein DB35_09355 [Streptomyces abyssalis]OEV04724.1 hypothetical protein AN219_37170 [Streptomyces nanshensis]
MTESAFPATEKARHHEPDGAPSARRAKQTPLDHMGGTTGLVYTMLPIVAFILANGSFGLTAAICAAVGVALVISVLRLVRKEPLQPALSGLFGVAVAAFVSWQTGSAKGFFLLGIWSNLALGVLFLVSVLVRRPLAGVVWGALNGTGTAWLKDKPSRHCYDIATLTLVGVFAARFVVWQWLYEDDETGWLGVARIAMGYPLLGLALLVVLWAGRRSGKRLKALAAQQPAGQQPAGSA